MGQGRVVGMGKERFGDYTWTFLLVSQNLRNAFKNVFVVIYLASAAGAFFRNIVCHRAGSESFSGISNFDQTLCKSP